MSNLYLSLSLLIYLLIASPAIVLSGAATLPSDVAALSALKSAINPSSINPWSCLASWNFASDPCRPIVPSHFTCGITCTAAANSSPPLFRITAITLDPAGYSGYLSPSLANLTLLSHIDLFDNSFHGPIPPSISSLTSLLTLVLASNSFSGPIPNSLSKLPNIQTIDLSRNSLTGTIPTFPPNSLSALASLDLSFNRLSGPLPNSLPPNLLRLALRGNSISGPLKRSPFQQLKYLEVAELAANRFGGKLEGWFFLLPSLQQVDLANNTITSVQVWNSTGGGGGQRLVAIDLSFNQIQGDLPAELAGYPSLVAVSARHNRLRGQIPWQYGKFRRLFLDGNFLNGQVPSGLLMNGDLAGSLGDNCLEKCPASASVCSPSQKPDWVCKQVYAAGGRGKPHRPSP